MADKELNIKIGELKDVLRVMRICKKNVLIEGEPGIGKTAILHEFATENNLRLITKVAAQMDATDISGIPAKDGDVCQWLRPSWLPTDGDGIIFFDELANAPQLVWNSLQKLIQERELNDYHVPDGWTFVAASNRVADRAGANKLTTAMGSRFVRITVTHDLDNWCAHYALPKSKDGVEITRGVYPSVVSFLRFRRELFHNFERTADKFPCARTWDTVSEMAWSDPDERLKPVLYAGAVGEAAMIEYLAHERLYNKLKTQSIDAILLKPDSAEVPTDPSAMYAIISALARVATKENFGRVMKYLKRCRKDFMVACMNDLVVIKPELQSTPEFTSWGIENQKLLTGSGVR